MYFCSNCGTAQEPGARFCKNCGTPIAEAVNPQPQPVVAPVVAEPVYQAYNAPVYAEPVYAEPVYAEPEISGKTKALGFVGMGLAIFGLVLSVFGIIYTLMFAALDGAFAFGYSIGFGIFSLPISIVGGVLAGNSKEQGNNSAACTVGSIMRVFGVILSCLMFFIGFIALFG